MSIHFHHSNDHFWLLQTCEETRCPSIFPSFFPIFSLVGSPGDGLGRLPGLGQLGAPIASGGGRGATGPRRQGDRRCEWVGCLVAQLSSWRFPEVSSSSWENFWVESMGISWLKIGRCSGSWEYGGFQLVMRVPHCPPWIMDGFCERDNSI